MLKKVSKIKRLKYNAGGTCIIYVDLESDQRSDYSDVDEDKVQEL